MFLGAVRRYAPGLRFDEDVRRHRLWLAPAIERANAMIPAGGFLETQRIILKGFGHTATVSAHT